jgi:pectate lyase
MNRKIRMIFILAAFSAVAPASAASESRKESTGGTLPGKVQLQKGVVFTSSGGWFETGFAEWENFPSASGFNAYCKGAGEADAAYQKIDPELVRNTRVDVPGLKGNAFYDLKIVPLQQGTEVPEQASVVRIQTRAHDRSGFAFDKRSPRGELGTSGGYQPDGTVDPAATILYLSDATKDTVQMEVTRGKKTEMHTGLVEIQQARSKAKSSSPLIVRFIGTVRPPAALAAQRLKMMQLKDSGNITYEGIGVDAQLDGWGLDFQRCTNVVVRNLSFKDQPEDQLSFQNNCLNLWIHHNDHFPGRGLPGGEADKIYGDGSLDIKSGSSWVSVSYNHFHATQKTSGVGFGRDTDALVMTFHHNFYDRCGSRMPRISYISMHVYNTYFKEAQTYAIAAAHGCSAFVENNYFEKCERPMIIASQGHDLSASGKSTLSKNPGGTIKIQGNFLDGYSSDPVRFDAALDASPGPAVKGGAVYNQFDRDFGSSYPYSLDSPEDAKAKVLQSAGRLKASPPAH